MTETEEFFQANDVFSLEEMARALAIGEKAALARLKYHRQRGRVKSVSKGIYASVPPGVDAGGFQPDRYLTVTAVRPDAIFSYHAALELLGAAHSDWSECTVFTRRRRSPLSLGSVRIRFLHHPPALQRKGKERFGTQPVNHGRQTLRVTGPERTLLDGLRQPGLAGGLEELFESAAGFRTLDLKLTRRLLEAYDEKALWAAAGWFLEKYRNEFSVSEDYLASLEARRPKSPQYLPRSERGGIMLSRWNLIVPAYLVRGKGPGEL